MFQEQLQAEQFLHQRYPLLHLSDDVQQVTDYLRQYGTQVPNTPADKLHHYLGFLADTQYGNDGIITGDPASIERQIEAHVVQAADVPESYFDLQCRILRERGHGNVTITSEMRRQLVEAAQAEQRTGLNNWVEYLGSQDGGYPDWFKYYTFEAVVKMGAYNKEKAEFQKRSSGTMAGYPELNREALAYVFDKLNAARVNGDQKQQDQNLIQESADLQALLKTANFAKLYAHALQRVVVASPESLQDTQGSWKKFTQSTDPRASRSLAHAVQGSGWCTAGQTTAHDQLSGGDFYVYRTRNAEGQEVVPRIAIRMQDGRVAEVRGIQKDQELEPAMTDIAMKRLEDLPGGQEYRQTAADMKHLTVIERALKQNPTAILSRADVKFLYELDRSIQGFGYSRDPRINELKQLRGEQDTPELQSLAVEHVRESFEASYQGYATIIEQVNAMRPAAERLPLLSQEAMQALFDAKLAEWQASGLFNYVAERIVSHGEIHTPVITPEGLVSSEEIMQLAYSFGETQPYATYVEKDLYSQYTARELSGNGQLKIRLLPSEPDAKLSALNVTDKRHLLGEYQAAHPELHYQVPSVLENLVRWQTLRAAGDRLQDSNTWTKTVVTHFDLEPKQLGRWRLPYSFVYRDGKPFLAFAFDNNHYIACLAVG